jgi:hypothetical protein
MDRTIDRHISAVNVAIYPVEDGKFGKYAVAKDLLNLLIEKKKSIKVNFRDAESVQIANNNSGYVSVSLLKTVEVFCEIHFFYSYGNRISMADSFMAPVGFDGCRNKFCQDCRNTYTYY